MANAQSLLAVLADPTRQTLVDALRQGPLTVGELAERVPVSRSAVSQHLQVLKTAQIVQDEAVGTRRVYRLQPQALGELRAYFEALWGDALAGFAGHVRAGQRRSPRSKSR
ncbi:MAG: metalloregulator ArsR/SmtB family transcription factor [Pseudomonadota bacterium]